MIPNPMVIADALEAVKDRPHNTAVLCMLDEQTIAFRYLSPELLEAQRAFRLARTAHKDGYTFAGEYSDEAWDQAVAAAGRLAGLLRELGPPLVAVVEPEATPPSGGERSDI